MNWTRRLATQLAWLMAGSLVAGQVGAVSLEALIERALAENPDYQRELARRDEVREQVVEARADAFPQVDLVGSWSRSRNPSLLNSPDFAEFLDEFPGFEPREQELTTLSVEATQTIYGGGRVRVALEAARVVAEVVEEEIETRRLDLALDTALAAFDVLRVARALETVAIQAESRERALEVVQARYDLGDATELERLRARASLAEVEPIRAELGGARRVALSRLASLVGEPSGATLSVDELTLPPIDEIPSLEALLARLERRSELASRLLETRLLELQAEAVQTEARPEVELVGAYGRQARDVRNLDEPLFADWRVLLSVRWSLFDGFRRSGQLGQLASQRDQARLEEESLRRELELELEQAYWGWVADQASWEASRLAASASREAAEVAEASYQEGVALQADLLAAQDQRASAELDEVRALFDLWEGRARLARALGEMPTTDLGRRPREQTTAETAEGEDDG